MSALPIGDIRRLCDPCPTSARGLVIVGVVVSSDIAPGPHDWCTATGKDGRTVLITHDEAMAERARLLLGLCQ